MRFFLCFGIGMMLAWALQAQREHTWMMGNVGLTFNDGSLTSFPTGNAGFNEASATVCDPSGKLLFYTDGTRIYDVSHQVMANGDELLGSPRTFGTSSTTQGALIMPIPEKPLHYYVFSLTSVEMATYSGRLYYSVVDMSLNGGLGGVMQGQKGILLDSNLTEKMTGVVGDRCNLWLIVRSRVSPVYKSFEVSASGINRQPVLSKVGSFEVSVYNVGELNPSLDGKKLVSTSIDKESGLEILDFNPATGELSGARLIDGKVNYYGACFSPDRSKVYATVYSNGLEAGGLYQFDLSAPDPAASKIKIDQAGFSKLKSGPDGKIYYVDSTYYLSVLQQPNALGAAVDLKRKVLRLEGWVQAGLPNVVPVVLRDTAPGTVQQVVAGCWQTSALLAVDPAGWGYLWEDGSMGSSILARKTGTFSVSYYTAPCTYHVDTFIVDFSRGVLPAIETGNSCTGIANGTARAVTYAGDTVRYTFTWRDAGGRILSVADSLSGIPAGNYTVAVHTASCDTLLPVQIGADDFRVAFQADTIVCMDELVAFSNLSDPHFTDFYWDFGDGKTSLSPAPAHAYTAAGSYAVQLIAGGTVCRDTLIRQILVDAPFAASLQKDMEDICTGMPLQLSVAADATLNEVSWNFGEGLALATADRTLSHAYDLPGIKAIEATLHFRACPELRLQDQLTVHPLPVVDLGPDTTICAGVPVRYLSNRAPGGEGYRYLWNTGAVTPELPLRQEGLYNLMVTTPWGCAGSDEVRVARGCYLDIPNAFSPNGDGVNDYFFPRQSQSPGISSFRMEVKNRWGQVLFVTTDTRGRGWDGDFNGVAQPAGVYVYSIALRYSGQTAEVFYGNVTLIR